MQIVSLCTTHWDFERTATCKRRDFVALDEGVYAAARMEHIQGVAGFPTFWLVFASKHSDPRFPKWNERID
jgi:hypothetical protein